MASVQTQVESLLQGLQKEDPRLYDALIAMNNHLEFLTQEVDPLVRQAGLATGGTTESLEPPTGFAYAFPGPTLRFVWSTATGAVGYEIREGTDWSSATFLLRTPSLQADVDPVLSGTHNYLIKSFNSGGQYSALATALVVSVPTISAVVISSSVIDNNVLLTWVAPSSVFNLSHYEVYKDGVLIGTVNSTFTAIFETAAGTYVYKVLAVDVAGNTSSDSSVSVDVNTPPDFALQAEFDSVLDGARVNALLIDGPKLLVPTEDKSFEDHFIDHAFPAPQDQVDAGYPIYIQPANITGSYDETIDFGSVFNNVILSAIWNYVLLVPTENVTVLVKMKVSDDDITYTAFTNGASQFFDSIRYLKIRLEFTGANDFALMELYNLHITMDVKRENDGGSVDALSTDALGTEILFNKAFKDIESITCTVKSTKEPFITIFKFTDVPNPTSFFVFVFDTTGNRVSKTVDWKARGIL